LHGLVGAGVGALLCKDPAFGAISGAVGSISAEVYGELFL
jgi:hypothetical protein